ncbi:thiol reductant ABC exporter subunit CydD [Rhodopseudomonas palustris]|uniref:Thiol reductant ABC exporter subunit CydD n=1 Tax=Rhodopseudomonas palustris TaxID=1076 RepID=A0A323UVQ3_RHOPL|nr:thiol reductant ABC exporter subunit CydD [Rhodopseudomonas palustris]PZA11728.1 thiol reductant ABC exporter subunit CydD [Rhodopseudomonas palustris]
MTARTAQSAELLRSLRAVAGRHARAATVAAAVWGVLAVATAQLIAIVVDRLVFGHAALAAIVPLLALLAGVALLRAAAAWLTERAAFEASAKVRRHLFRRALERVSALGPVRLGEYPPGELVALLTDSLDAVAPLWRSWQPAIVRAAVVPVAVLAVVTWRDPLAAAILVVALPLLVWFSILAGQGAERASGERWAGLARLGGHLLDQIRGLPERKLAGTADNAVAAVKVAAERYGRETMAVLRIAFLSALVVEFVATAAIAGVAIAVGFRLLWGEMDFATGLFVLLLAPEFFAPLRDLGARRHAKLEALTALDRLAPLLDPPPAAGRPYVVAAPPSIRFDEVRVVHADGRVALDGFSLDIAAGEHVALVGPSGAGKSTVLALLLRFIEPSSGRVLIDGVPLSEIDPASWRRALVAMSQTPQFFEGSIADNVVMGRAATPDDAALREALRAADAAAWVDRLPDGTATLLAERGANLSGGEAQRFALARAIYAAGPLLLFDEPTAHLDAEAQRVVMQGLARLSEGRTVLTIAHRRETIAAADRVVVIERGRIAAQGTPAQLLAGTLDRFEAERTDA